LRFFQIENEPTEKQLRYYYFINFLDMTGSYYFTRNNPNIKEANPFLPKKPSAGQFILHKAITTPVVAQNVEAGQMTIMNAAITLVVLKNIHTYQSTPKCAPNFMVDGSRVPC
tara:strand:+ start:1403 stop:1741 length:339 start_codon:yes stop_codon:yes gene_type:complete